MAYTQLGLIYGNTTVGKPDVEQFSLFDVPADEAPDTADERGQYVGQTAGITREPAPRVLAEPILVDGRRTR